MLSKGLRVLKTYGIVVVMGVGITGMLLFMSSESKAIAQLESDVETSEGLITDAEKTLSGISKEFDAKEHQAKIKERTVSATKIGEEMIAVDDALTSFYKTNEPLPEDKKEKDALFAKLEEAKAKNTELTGAGEADHIKTWQLNPEWTLKLESVITYQDTERVPVVFSMTTKDGKSAGLITAVYEVNNHQLDSISRHYTTDGLEDEIDVGGR